MPGPGFGLLPELPDPPPGARNVLLVVLDSLRYDSWIAAAPRNLGRLGQVEKRYSYATWTPPSHLNMLMGMFPHPMPAHLTRAAYVRREFLQHSRRFQIDVRHFQRKHVPAIFLPTLLRGVGYHTRAIVSMPVLNAFTAINRDWESYEQMSRHNDLAGMIGKLRFDPDRPTFYLLNVGETHYPYTVGDAAADGPDRPGVFDPDPRARQQLTLDRLLTLDEMHQARERQIHACAYVDTLFARLYAAVPRGTYIVVTADHGDLFGEDGMFGHGAVVHQKVLEVPFVEGVVPS